MKIVNFSPHYKEVGASGICPHCEANSYFRPIATHIEEVPGKADQNVISATQCEACKGFCLVVGRKNHPGHPCVLQAFYPLGKPNEHVDKSVPEEIAEDFREGLRCQWIKSYKGCVVMCRRAIQSSAIACGAKGGALIEQIDDLLSKGKITEALRDFAHAIRLTGNIGAHPDKDGLESVGEPDASDIVEFTREYLDHVYVMPAKLNARKAKP